MKNENLVKKIAIMGMLLALDLVLSKLSIHTATVKVGFSFIPQVICAIIFGPIASGILGAAADVLGWVINPVGPFFPGFTITAFLTGIVYGLFLRKKVTIPRIIGATAIVQFVIGLILNTYNLKILYGYGFVALLPGRLLQAAILFVIQSVIIYILDKSLVPQLKKLTFSSSKEAVEAN